VVELGETLPVEQRPRATCAICLVQDRSAYWAHIGDSRIYHIRRYEVVARTRDHSHVEGLVREGRITTEEARHHPMRNFVECCLGGDAMLTEMTVSARHALEPGDILLTCTDGIWANLTDAEIASYWDPGRSLEDALDRLGATALGLAAPFSDNASATVLRWLG
jgi:serine/threonine protein phosphatase PrpC